VSALDLKLMRDLTRMWPQALAIALVLAAGVATLIIAVGAHHSLDDTRNAYYERYRFAHVFASAKRAPRELLGQIREIPGIAVAEARIEATALIDIADMAEPATGRIISVPPGRGAMLNALHVREGRMPEAGHEDEVAVSAAFADAHGFAPADRISVLLNGRKRDFRITAIVHSPEFIYTIGPGNLVPDNRRFGVFWMPQDAAEAALDLEGAFNSLTARIMRGTSTSEVIDRIDALLKRYGGRGAFARKDQISHAFIDAELLQLEVMARVMPPIFLAVAAFLINMTLARLVALEREQIGLLKAIGYGRGAIAGHYLKFALAICLLGLVAGIGIGIWLGRGLTELYAEFYHFPFLHFSRSPRLYVLATVIALVAGAGGAARSVWSAVRLPPAVAMAPPAPPLYRRTFMAGLIGRAPISQLSLMVLRQMARWPARAALTTIGIALSCGILLGSMFAIDSVETLIDVTFFRSDRQDATVTFTDVTQRSVVEDVRHLPGVLTSEPFRVALVRIRSGHRERRTSLLGKPVGADLSRALDGGLRPITPPRHGIALSRTLAELLHVRVGDRVEIEVLEGRGQTAAAVVLEIAERYVTTQAIMELGALNRLLGEAPVVTGVHFAYDPAEAERIFAAIKSMPNVAAMAIRRHALESLRNTLAENIDIMTTVYLALASVIAFGVIYNSSRIRLSERAREFASLRVLGFSASEVYWVLFAEFAILILAAIPFGWVIGYALAYVTVEGFESELYRIPLVIGTDKYAIAALVVLAAAAVSAVIVRRRIANLDLIAVLKTRE
jgi:putative ABC transport system permease protein